jgi:hypothetical protein
MHDDTVMAVMLALQDARPPVVGVTSYVQRNISSPRRQRPR